MISLGVVYMMISVVLFAIAVVVHFNSSSLGLPISPVISILTAILPVASFFGAYMQQRRQRGHSRDRPTGGSRLRPLVIQALVALAAETALATLLLEAVVPSRILSCVLEQSWAAMFRAHDAAGIRRVQDGLDCCGLNSVRDRAYPFPGSAPSTCAETYGRTVACAGPWRRATQTNAGVDFGVVLAVGALQIFGLLFMGNGTSWWTAWSSRKWTQTITRPRESSQPLLTELDHEDEEAAAEGQTPERQGYGATEDDEARPRVEPSPIYG